MTVYRSTPSGKECKVKIIKEIKIKKPLIFNISPNPAQEILRVNIVQEEDVLVQTLITIQNSNGSIVYQKHHLTNNKGELDIPIEKFSIGMYYIKIGTKEDVAYKKFIKIR
ncbi:MAG: T9SS type A sorting domain-containing protein [Saprospiraceae bacterium]|nr:T9SS type A sorting domain-containing protein [Saprospiraceae bacterium]